MNCDEFLPALETGGPLRRRLARRHAAGCPRCAAAAARFEALKGQWADAPPLSAGERQLWARAATGAAREAVVPQRPIPRRVLSWRLWGPVSGLAAACVVIAVVLVARPTRDDTLGGRFPPPPMATQPTTRETSPRPAAVRVVPVASSAALADLSGAVDRLDAEMQELRRTAERAEARRQVAMALDRFERL
jgi:hypothetical protein